MRNAGASNPRTAGSSNATQDERRRQLNVVLEDVARCRLRGEQIDVAQLIDSHRGLMPELASEIEELRRVLAARAEAAEGSQKCARSPFGGIACSERGGAGVEEEETRASGVEVGRRGNVTRSSGVATEGGRGVPMAEDAIPGYRVIRQLHRGGQGVVYLAVQKSTARQVAIKVLREGPFAGPNDRVRFEMEAKILAQLRHPNIVTLHDYGDAAGNAYFVMDFIDGEALDEWKIEALCETAGHDRNDGGARGARRGVQSNAARGTNVDGSGAVGAARGARSGPSAAAALDSGASWGPRRRGVRGRRRETKNAMLDVFAEICDAVHAAHLRGVIHRDLKPSNIRMDRQGRPHVLDFGLARQTNDERNMTREGQFVGTLAWASPEQAAGKPELIDIRTDVYALGLVLYFLLTRRQPYSVEGPLGEVLERIRHEEATSPRSMNAWVDDELETIVLKCLRKEPERRYQSAGELMRDIRRYQQGEPIEAKRESRWYMLRKTLARHRLEAGAAGVILTLIVGASVALYVMYRDARAQEAAARSANQETREALDLVERKREESEANYRRASRILGFLNEMLASGTPEEARGRDPRVSEVLARAAERVDAEMKDDPESEASVRGTIGGAYASMGAYEEAERQLRAALEIQRGEDGDAIGLARALKDLADVLWRMNRNEEAEALLREAMTVMGAAGGSPANLRVGVMSALGSVMQSAGRTEEAEGWFLYALKNGEGDGDSAEEILLCRGNLGLLLLNTGRLEEAEPMIRAVMAEHERLLGEDHPTTLGDMNNMAGLLSRLERFDEAEAMYRRAIDVSTRVRGEDHPDTFVSMNNLALLMRSRNRLDEAEAMLARVLEMRKGKLGEEHEDTLITMVSLANIRMARGAAVEAEPVMRRAVEIAARSMPEGHPTRAVFEGNLGRCLMMMKRYEEAEGLLLASLKGLEGALGSEHPYTKRAREGLAELYEAWGRVEEARRYRSGGGE